MELIGEIVDEKKVAEKLAKGIREREGKLAKLIGLANGIKKSGFTSYESIMGRIAEIKAELKELRAK